MASPIVTSLPQYINAKADQLAYKAATGAKTLKNIRIQPGIWGKGAINIITPSITFNGSGCGFSETSTGTISQRNITTGLMVVNATYCDEQVYNTYLEMAFNEGGHIEDAAFFDKYIGSFIEAVNKQLDVKIWQGDTGNGDPFDGFIEGITTDASYINPSLTTLTSASTAADVYNYTMSMVMNMPTDALSNGRGVVFMGEDLYNKLVIGLVNANLYHYGVDNLADGLIIPGTNVRAIGVNGLTGQYKMVAGDADNFVFGTGFGTDDKKTDFKFFFDDGDDVWKLIIKFTAGVNTIYPDEVVYGA